LNTTLLVLRNSSNQSTISTSKLSKKISRASRELIFRANVEIPAGQTAATRSDIEIFYDGLPEPIDLELDHKNRVLYWTDRGDLQHRGNSMVGGISRIVVRPTSSTGARIILVAVSLLMLSIRKMPSDFGASQRQWWRRNDGNEFQDYRPCMSSNFPRYVLLNSRNRSIVSLLATTRYLSIPPGGRRPIHGP
jgi:hypothetical protein